MSPSRTTFAVLAALSSAIVVLFGASFWTGQSESRLKASVAVAFVAAFVAFVSAMLGRRPPPPTGKER